MQFFNVLEKNAAAAAMIFSKTYRYRAAAAMTSSKTCRHRHGDRGAAAVAAAAAPPWTSLVPVNTLKCCL
jgi:hypothetical protein